MISYLLTLVLSVTVSSLLCVKEHEQFSNNNNKQQEDDSMIIDTPRDNFLPSEIKELKNCIMGLCCSRYKDDDESLRLVLKKYLHTHEEHKTDILTEFLHSAVFNHNINITQLLLEHGADVNVQDEWGMTPLHVASCLSETKMIKLLKKYKAREDILDKKDRIPRDYLNVENKFSNIKV